MPSARSNPSNGLRITGVLLLLAVSGVVCALALGWRPIKPPPPPPEQVDSESMEQSRQADIEAQKKVERGEVILGGP